MKVKGKGDIFRKPQLAKFSGKVVKKKKLLKDKNVIQNKNLKTQAKSTMKQRNGVLFIKCNSVRRNETFEKLMAGCESPKKKVCTSVESLIKYGNTNKQCKLKVIEYQMPLPTDFDDESDMGSSDFGSLVESDEPEEPSFIEEKVGEFVSYQIPHGSFLLLYGKSKIFFHGFMEVSVLYGSINILGKILDKTSPPCKVYSPKGAGFLALENCNIKETDIAKNAMKTKLQALKLDKERCREVVIYKLKVDTAVIHCRYFTDKTIDFIEDNMGQKLFPKLHNGLRCKFRNQTSADWNVIKCNPEWRPLLNHMTDIKDNKLLICGGKGLGKSTLLRHLVNQLLNSQEEVYIVDLDPGQPEFTMPGAISFVKVTTPLLGPNYTHLQPTLTTVFVPNINVSADHDIYLECVKKLMDEVPTNVPLIINYMGFTKGIGALLTAAIINIVHPTIVAELKSRNEAKNFTIDLTPQNIREQIKQNELGNVSFKDYTLITMDAMVDGEINGFTWKPKEIREMCVLAYMSQVLPKRCNFLTEKNVKIFQAPFDEINILYNGKPVNPQAANANIVALCLEDASTCVGWGIVRGYSRKFNRILILTPIPEKRLEDVKNLVVGSVTMPSSLYLRQHPSVHGLIPYTFKGQMLNFARTPKRN